MSAPQETTVNPQSDVAVQLKGVKFSYNRSDAFALNIKDWSISVGQTVFIHGPSGVGKSSLLNLLAGLTVPNEGSVDIMGCTISQLTGAQRDRFRARHVGVIFQQFNLIPWLTVHDNIAVAHYFSNKEKLNKVDFKNFTTALLDRLGLPKSYLAHKTKDLSIGEQQRVAIARALINKPELIIADEPTSSLDSAARDLFMQLLMDCVTEYSSTLVLVSHDKTLAERFDVCVDLPSLACK